MIYIDLNMVRAGGVTHPSEWKAGGYSEIIHLSERHKRIDRNRLQTILGYSDRETFCRTYVHLVNETIANNAFQRQDAWTAGIA